MDSVIEKLTSLNQKAYNKDCYIQEANINTVHAKRHCEIMGPGGNFVDRSKLLKPTNQLKNMPSFL